MDRVQRRDFLIAAGALLAASLAAEAQQAAKVARLGYLAADRTANPHLQEAFRQGLRELGYVEGRNLVIEYRDAEGKLEQFPALGLSCCAQGRCHRCPKHARQRWPPSSDQNRPHCRGCRSG